MTDGYKIAAVVTGNGVGTAAQFVVASSQQVESYLRIGLLLGQIALVVVSVIYAFKKLKKKD